MTKFFKKLHPLNIRSKPEFGYSIWMIIGQFFVSVSAFAITYVMANYVPDEVVGSYRFVLATYSSVTVFGLIGLGTALYHAASNGKTGSYTIALQKKLLYGFGATLVFFAIALYYFFFEVNRELSLAFIVVGITFPLIETYALYGPYLSGVRDFKHSSLCLLWNRISTTILLVLIIFIDHGLLVLVTTYCIGQLLAMYVSHRLTLYWQPPCEEVDESMMSYAHHVTYMSVIGSLSVQLDKYILFVFFGPVELAKFWVAAVLPQEVNRGVSIVVNTFFPRFVANKKEKNIHDARKLYAFASLCLIVVVVMYSFVAPLIFTWLLPRHQDALMLSLGLMVAYACVPYYFVWQIFAAEKEVKTMYILNTLEPVLLMSFYALLVPFFGVWGIVYTIFTKNLVFTLHSLYYILKSR